MRPFDIGMGEQIESRAANAVEVDIQPLRPRLVGCHVQSVDQTPRFKQFGLQRLEMKLKNAAALTAHLAYMASPILVLAMARRLRKGFWAIPLAALGLLSPVIAGAAMAMSSVSVVTNALLLSRWSPRLDRFAVSSESRRPETGSRDPDRHKTAML